MEIESFGIGISVDDHPIIFLRMKPDIVRDAATSIGISGMIGIAFGYDYERGPWICLIDLSRAKGDSLMDVARKSPDAIIAIIYLMEDLEKIEDKKNLVKWLEKIASRGELEVHVFCEPVLFETGIPSHPYAITEPYHHAETRELPEDQRKLIEQIASLTRKMIEAEE